MDSFDKVFQGKNCKASVSRKLEDGTTRTARLAEGAVPVALTLADFAEAAMKGTTLAKRTTDKGASLSMSVSGVTGAAARSAIMAMGNDTAADVPEPVRRRGKAVEPSANGTPVEPTATN